MHLTDWLDTETTDAIYPAIPLPHEETSFTCPNVTKYVGIKICILWRVVGCIASHSIVHYHNKPYLPLLTHSLGLLVLLISLLYHSSRYYRRSMYLLLNVKEWVHVDVDLFVLFSVKCQVAHHAVLYLYYGVSCEWRMGLWALYLHDCNSIAPMSAK